MQSNKANAHSIFLFVHGDNFFLCVVFFIRMECYIWFMVQDQVMAIHKFPFDQTFVSKHERIRNQLIYAASIVALYRCYYYVCLFIVPFCKRATNAFDTPDQQSAIQWKTFGKSDTFVNCFDMKTNKCVFEGEYSNYYFSLDVDFGLSNAQYPNIIEKRWKKLIICWNLKWNALWNWYTILNCFNTNSKQMSTVIFYPLYIFNQKALCFFIKR